MFLPDSGELVAPHSAPLHRPEAPAPHCWSSGSSSSQPPSSTEICLQLPLPAPRMSDKVTEGDRGWPS